jgi:hypothetical protein
MNLRKFFVGILISSVVSVVASCAGHSSDKDDPGGDGKNDGSPVGHGSVVNETEPNDTFDTAQRLDANLPEPIKEDYSIRIKGKIEGSGDTDVFVFQTKWSKSVYLDFIAGDGVTMEGFERREGQTEPERVNDDWFPTEGPDANTGWFDSGGEYHNGDWLFVIKSATGSPESYTIRMYMKDTLGNGPFP